MNKDTGTHWSRPAVAGGEVRYRPVARLTAAEKRTCRFVSILCWLAGAVALVLGLASDRLSTLAFGAVVALCAAAVGAEGWAMSRGEGWKP